MATSDNRVFRYDGTVDNPDLQERLLRGSPSGNESISCYGAFDGATVRVMSQIVLTDGTQSILAELPNGAYTASFTHATQIGEGNNIWVEITGATVNTDLYFKVSEVQGSNVGGSTSAGGADLTTEQQEVLSNWYKDSNTGHIVSKSEVEVPTNSTAGTMDITSNSGADCRFEACLV